MESSVKSTKYQHMRDQLQERQQLLHERQQLLEERQQLLHERQQLLQHQPSPAIQVISSSDAELTENHNNGKFHKVIDRLFHNSLFASLLRRTDTPSDSHNVEAQQAPAKAKEDAKEVEAADAKQEKGRKLREAAMARKLAETFYTVDTEAYNLNSVIDYYTKEDARILPRAMKFLFERQRIQRTQCGGDGSANPDAATVVHPLLDKVVLEFCRRFGMTETGQMPTCDERIFLWLGRDQALQVLSKIGRRKSLEQMYFVNRINVDHVLADLQFLCTRLGGCVARDGQVYQPHICTDPEKISEAYQSGVAGAGPVPRAIFLDRQVMCRHVYLKQDFGLACEVKSCPNYGKRLCTCFQLDIFIPDTITLATKRNFEDVRTNLIQKVYGDQRWLLRASSLKGGNGVQLFDTAPELETFLRYDLRKRLRGHFFVMQRSIKNPLLLDNKRFDVRMFLLVIVLTDRRVLSFLHPGYLRLAQLDYEPASNDLRCHLTWPFTWEPDYNRYKGEAAASADYCRTYAEAHESAGLPSLAPDRAIDTAMRRTTDIRGNRFLPRLGRIVHYLTSQIDTIIADKPGSWQLFGLDLQVDTDKDVWLHDVMTYPCQDEPDLRSEAQNRVVPAVLTESLALVLELNQRDLATRSKALWLDLPDVPVNQLGFIAAQKNFLWLYSTDIMRLTTCSKPERQRTKPPQWYQQWRLTEDYNDYVLYLKNYRGSHFPVDDDLALYGRKTFDNSPAEKFRRSFMKKTRPADIDIENSTKETSQD